MRPAWPCTTSRQHIRLDPSGADAYNGRGSARLRFGEHREAVADAEKALSLGKPDSQLFYHAARVYALAAVVVAAEVSKNGRESLILKAHYQERAATLAWRDAQADARRASARGSCATSSRPTHRSECSAAVSGRRSSPARPAPRIPQISKPAQ